MALLVFPGRTNRAVKVLAALLIVVQLGQLIWVSKTPTRSSSLHFSPPQPAIWHSRPFPAAPRCMSLVLSSDHVMRKRHLQMIYVAAMISDMFAHCRSSTISARRAVTPPRRPPCDYPGWLIRQCGLCPTIRMEKDRHAVKMFIAFQLDSDIPSRIYLNILPSTQPLLYG